MNTVLNCLIVDDQEISRMILKKLMSFDPSLILIGECASAEEAYIEVQKHKVDILFLDVEMPGISGIELAKILEGHKPMIIFTTSSTEYAVDAFDLNAVDFLCKPVSPQRFIKAIEKAKDAIKSTELSLNTTDNEFVFIRDSNIIRKVKIDDILYLEASGDYVKLYLSNKTYSIHSSLKSIEQKLPQNVFIRTHRSFIINVGKIDTIEGGTLIIDQNMVPISDAYRNFFNKRIQLL